MEAGRALLALDLPLDPDPGEVVRLLTRGGGGSRRAQFLARVAEVAEQALALARPAAVHGVWANPELPPGLAPSPATRTALGVVTVGAELPDACRALSAAGDLARAVILDAWGSQLVEALAERLDAAIRAAQAPLPGGPRVSPGYANWGLDRQPLLFAQLPAERIGVSLGPGHFMSPVKSISFAIPFGPAWAGSAPPSREQACRDCGMESCDMQRC